ncbi:MAG: STAS domain-containing protein [Anaerolineales bacterium]|jgi:anti-anti-sigma factor
MISDLKNTVEQVQGAVPVTIFHLRGWLDVQSEEQFVKWAGEAYENGTRYLLLDLSELDTLTSAGMRAIQKVYKQYTPAGTPKEVVYLKMASAPPQVYHALKVTGFLQTIPMYESVQSAIDAFKAP